MLSFMNKYIKKILSVLICAVFSALFIAVFYYTAPKIESVKPTSGEIEYSYKSTQQDGTQTIEKDNYIIGQDIAAIRIKDINRIGTISQVNYVPNRFVKPLTENTEYQIVDLTKPFNFAEKGTLFFLIMNLNPAGSDFLEQADLLSEYKIGDFWHFTLSLPKIFCASNIYLSANLAARNGTIENYDFIDFSTTYDIKTETFSEHTERVKLDLQFYTRRQAINLYQIVTIHYQSFGTTYSGIQDCPIIGIENEVESTTQLSQNLLLSFAILSVIVLAVFIVLSVLEQTNTFIPAIVWIAGITILFTSRFFLNQSTTFPLFHTAFTLAAPFVILSGAFLYFNNKIGKIPIKYIFAGLTCMGALFAFIRPFLTFEAVKPIDIACLVIKSIGSFGLIAFIAHNVLRKKDDHGILQTALVTVIAVAAISSLFLPQIYPAQYNPMFWLCITITASSFVSVFIIFMETKKANVYLTANLHMEVERQLKDIRSIISERDNLLQFVSHDMKKPLQSSIALLDTAIEREKDNELIKTLQIIKQNDVRVVTNLSEIGAYAKFNYIAEPSQVIDLSVLCSKICSFHTFDCNASGINLNNYVDKSINVFVKKQGLENAISNIIMNAVEHANCRNITLSVSSDKNRIVLAIADDGKGIDANMDVFKPYVTEKTESGGIGLFICKNIVESMNGELTYSSKNGGTVFFISLLKA